MSQSTPLDRTVLDTGVTTATSVTVSDAVRDPRDIDHPLRVMTCTVDFGDSGGSGSDMAKTTVYGAWWVSSTSSKLIPQVVGRPDVSGVDDEDSLIDQVRAICTNIVDGVSFDVIAHAPEGTNGTFTVQIIGV